MDRRRLIIGAALTAAVAGCAETEAVPASARSKLLVDAARAQGRQFVVYDGGYTRIAYPGGDVPSGRGACTDVIIRAYRALGVDLQRLVHEDMAANFDQYPKLWGLSAPDPNIDHRRVPNLVRFFERSGASLSISKRSQDYQPGDVVAVNPQHIALVSDRRVRRRDDLLVVIQNKGFGVRADIQNFDSPRVTGHFRYGI